MVHALGAWCTIYNLENLSGHRPRMRLTLQRNFAVISVLKKTGLRIDQPTSDGGTTSTGSIARQ